MRLLQPSFARGEVSPEVQARTDLAAYPLGLKTCRNFIVTKFGAAENRAGTEYMSNYATGATDNGEDVILSGEISNFLLPFKPNDTDQYTVLITEKYVVPMLQGEFLEADNLDDWAAATTYNVNDFVEYNGETYVSLRNSNTNQTPDNTSEYWQHTNGLYYLIWPFWESIAFAPSRISYVQSIDVMYLCNDHARNSGNFGQAVPPYELRRLSSAPNRWELVPYNYKNGPFLNYNKDESIKVWTSARTGRVTLSSNINIFSPLHVGGLFLMADDDSADTGMLKITGFTNEKSVSALVIKKIPAEMVSSVAVLTKRGSTFQGDGSDVTMAVTGATSSVAANYLVSVTETFYDEYNGYAIYGSSYAMDSSEYTVDGGTDVLTFTVAPPATATVDVYERSVTTKSPTNLWAFGSWSPYQGYPELVSFFQDRLVFARTRRQPDTFWMSQAGDIESHEIMNPITDASAINRTIASREVNQINEIVPLDKLMFLTTDVEWVLSGGQGETITPVSISIKPQTHYGSANVNAEVVGNLCVYLQAKTNVPRNLSFINENNSYSSEDLSLLAAHLFEGYTIRKVVFQKTPNQSLWVLREDGVLLEMTYLPEQEVLAWGRHDTRNGEFVDIAVVEENNRDVLYALVQRAIEDDEPVYLERMASRFFRYIKDAFFVDSGKTYEGRNLSNPDTTYWALDAIEYDNAFLNLSATLPTGFGGIRFNRFGTKMYVLGWTGFLTIIEYDLMTPWLVSSAIANGHTLNPSAQEATPRDFCFNSDETKLYVVGTSNDTIYQYNLTTSGDISTATYSTLSFSVAAQEGDPTGLFLKDDGTAIYVVGFSDKVHQYPLGTPDAINTASYGGLNYSFVEVSGAQNISFNDDGSKMYLLDNVFHSHLYQYSLGTAWNVSTAVYDNIDVDFEEYFPTFDFPAAVFFKPDGSKLYHAATKQEGLSAAIIYQFSITKSDPKNLTLTGSGWTVNDQLTLTASGTGNTPFTANSVDDHVTLEIQDEDGAVTASVRVRINGYTSPTVVTVVPLKDVPAALQGVSTDDWVLAVDTITGLEHLEGETVAILSDGDVQEEKTVTDGTITLDYPGGTVHVGLPIEADLETLEVNIQGAETIRDKRKRIPSVTLQVKNTRGLKVGTTFDNLKDRKQRHREGYEESTNLQTGISRILVKCAFSEDTHGGHVCMRQSDPLPVTILGIIPEVEVANG